jgi:hypothetical protein
MEGPDEEELVDPEQRIGAIEERLQQEAAARAQVEREEAEADHIEGAIARLEEQEKRQFDAEEVSLITTYSRVHPLPSGAPDVQGAYGQLAGIFQRRQQEWLESKKNTGRKPPNGVPAVTAADLSTEEGRLKHAEAVARAHRASQEQ